MNKRQILSYSYDILHSHNYADLSNLDLTLMSFFQSIAPYSITKEMRYHYPNKHNIHFNRKRARPKSIISDDTELLKKLRSCLSKITETNLESMTDQIVKILSGKNYDWKDVSNHMYLSIIDNIFLAPIFVKLLRELETEYSLLIHHFHHLVLAEINNPKVFQDTITELGVDKSKRWQLSNSILLTELFVQKQYSPSFMVQNINRWLEMASVDNLIPLEILIKIIPKCKTLEIPPHVATKLQEISTDKTYPSRLRLLLTLPTTR